VVTAGAALTRQNKGMCDGKQDPSSVTEKASRKASRKVWRHDCDFFGALQTETKTKTEIGTKTENKTK